MSHIKLLKVMCGRDTINGHIAKLKKEHRLKRVGGRKDAYWEVLNAK